HVFDRYHCGAAWKANRYLHRKERLPGEYCTADPWPVEPGNWEISQRSPDVYRVLKFFLPPVFHPCLSGYNLTYLWLQYPDWRCRRYAFSPLSVFWFQLPLRHWQLSNHIGLLQKRLSK